MLIFAPIVLGPGATPRSHPGAAAGAEGKTMRRVCADVRCAGDEGVPSQDAALVLQGVLPGAVDCTDCRTCCRCVLISVLNQIM